jgi:hypothetical protein
MLILGRSESNRFLQIPSKLYKNDLGGGLFYEGNRLRAFPGSENASLVQGNGGCIEAKMNKNSEFRRKNSCLEFI